LKAVNGRYNTWAAMTSTQVLHRLHRRGIQERSGHRSAQGPDGLQRLKEAAERAKKDLSQATRLDINLPFINGRCFWTQALAK